MGDYTYLGKDTNTSLPNATPTVIPWEIEVHDSLGMFNPAQPTRITIPANVSKVRFSAQAAFDTNNDVDRRQIYIKRNGSDYPRGYISHSQNGGYANGSSVSFSAVSGIIDVEEGDYFELFAAQNSGSTMNFRGTNAVWWLCEVVA